MSPRRKTQRADRLNSLIDAEALLFTLMRQTGTVACYSPCSPRGKARQRVITRQLTDEFYNKSPRLHRGS